MLYHANNRAGNAGVQALDVDNDSSAFRFGRFATVKS